MTKKIEDVAKDYLLNKLSHPRYSFSDIENGDRGFDLWLLDKDTNEKRKVELKATNGSYKRPSNLFERLIFNAEIERELFEDGETVIARIFLGQQPYRLFIITNAILKGSANLKPEARYVLRGRINYDNSYTEIA